MDKKNRFQPLSNEKGVATIAMVVGVATAVLSYTAFTATSYTMMMSESKRQARLMMGFEVMRQIGEALQEARQRHHEQTVMLAAADCTGEPNGYTQTVGSFCLPPGGLCVDHPMDPNGNVAGSDICFAAEWLSAGASTTARFAELRQVQKKPSLMAQLSNGVRDFNHWYGKHAVEVAEALVTSASPAAHARRFQDYMPDFSTLTAPTHTFTMAANEECGVGAAPTNICMICDEAGGTAGEPRPACLRLAVCPKNLLGWGACDLANDGDWFWQVVAVTSPVVSL
ncbi:MAG: hypothetical protein AAF202_05555 [Pseudomonadota bacterium]